MFAFSFWSLLLFILVLVLVLDFFSFSFSIVFYFFRFSLSFYFLLFFFVFFLVLVNEFVIFSFLTIFVFVFVNENHTVVNKHHSPDKLMPKLPTQYGLIWNSSTEREYPVHDTEWYIISIRLFLQRLYTSGILIWSWDVVHNQSHRKENWCFWPMVSSAHPEHYLVGACNEFWSL